MKNFLRALILAGVILSGVPSAQAGWRHYSFWDDVAGMIYAIHPSGDLWYWICSEKGSGHCNFKKS